MPLPPWYSDASVRFLRPHDHQFLTEATDIAQSAVGLLFLACEQGHYGLEITRTNTGVLIQVPLQISQSFQGAPQTFRHPASKPRQLPFPECRVDNSHDPPALLLRNRRE